ncbi:F0F1 ATP synthase subunit A [Aurantimicrobium sp. INA4]|uniref:F0F1 ATP synthase subunit A n=1 Tax=Aurantimicrobium sp. INA4 TaxID=2986279 RepID=UPI002492FB68|nr:F0F1 ATP synthase subunit A [Aurantimicrobium sp. INA4]
MALLVNAVTKLIASTEDAPSFHGPSIYEFFPPVILFDGTPFEINRIILVKFFMAAILITFFALATRNLKIVPSKGQSLAEMALDVVRVNIAEDLLGKKDAKRFLPLLTGIFFTVLAMNIPGIIPGFNIAGTSTIGLPLVLALVAYVAFVYAGLKKHPLTFLKASLFPPGVPWPIYVIVTPIEFFSIFILRPITLALRLLMNMVAGHLLLVLAFSATWFFFFEMDGFWKLFGIGTFAFGFIFTLFEMLVAVLQAYVFTLLTTVYIQLALAEEH